MKIGEIIEGKYRIISEIGIGGMGAVYKVTDEKDFFALKICLERDPETIRRFRREVRMMKKIEHENVIQVIFDGLDNDIPYFVMPLCICSLDDKILELHDKPQEILKILQAACKGIHALHLSGIIHRDIKAKNILITENGSVKISDLGLGKFADRDSTALTSSNVYIGTQGYIPPEFFKVGGTKNADQRSDIYQLGKTIYNVFTNQNPILIETDRLPGGLLYVIRKCTADDPNSRYQVVPELETALYDYLLSLTPSENPVNSFKNLINIANENIRLKQYDSSNLEHIVHTLYGFEDDPEYLFRKFNEVPKALIEVMASNYPSICVQFFDLFSNMIDRYMSECRVDFSDADAIADILNRIFSGTSDAEMKVKVMQRTLYISVYFNRYYAMGIFDSMLISIISDTDAAAISAMLRDNINDYEQVADRVSLNKLHSQFQKIRLEINEKNKNSL